jgi:hypothetical protein
MPSRHWHKNGKMYVPLWSSQRTWSGLLAGGLPSWTNSSILSCRVTNSYSLAPEPAAHGLDCEYRSLPLANKACVRIPTYNGAQRRRGPSVPSLSPLSDYRFQRQPPLFEPLPGWRTAMRFTALFATITAILSALTPGSFGEDIQ